MKITGADVRLMLNGHTVGVLWTIVWPESVSDSLIWPRTGGHGCKLGDMRTIARGKVEPNEVEVVEVNTRVVSIRKGLAVYPGPEGFRLETLIVANENGTWSPAPVWVGERLDMSNPGVDEPRGT